MPEITLSASFVETTSASGIPACLKAAATFLAFHLSPMIGNAKFFNLFGSIHGFLLIAAHFCGTSSLRRKPDSEAAA
ncbi:MAG: hypothetical protein ACLS6G_08300 [Christensenellales bacterium]